MKRTATVITMLVAMPWFLALATNAPGGSNEVSISQDKSIPLTASKVLPAPPPVITGNGLPDKAHLSSTEWQQTGEIFPIHNPSELPLISTVSIGNASATPRNVIQKKETAIIPNTPDPNVILQGGDNFGSATVITSLPFYDTGTTSGYTNDYEGNCGGSGAPDVVYRFNPASDISIDISMCDATDYDSKVYVCANGDPLNIIACNDDFCSLQSSLLEVLLTGGNSYYIVVDGYSAYFGNYSLSVIETPFIPDPCDYGGNAIYSNLPNDGADGISDFRSTDGTYDRWAVDDFTLYTNTFISGTNWLCLSTTTFDWNSTADIMFLYDGGGIPGGVIYSFPDLPCTRTLTGRVLFGLDEYVYSVSGFNINLPSGTYWVGIRPNSGTSPNNYWETAPVRGNATYISLPDLGYPMWTPGSSVFGVDRDLSFCLMGNFGTDPCESISSIWHNGMPNYVNGWYDFRTADGVNDFFIVDNTSLANPTLIHALHWVTVDAGFDWNGTADYIILADAGGYPGAVIYEVHDVPSTRVASGNMPFSYPEYVYSISGLNINLPAGSFWFGMRAVGGSTGASYWLTSAGDGQPSYVDFTSFGYPRWTPSSTAMGADYEFSFCLEGEYAPPPDPCGNGTLLFSNGFPNLNDGLISGRAADGSMNEIAVDDIVLTQDAVIDDFHWFMLESTADWNGDADLLILADNAGSPGTIVYTQTDIPATRIPTGRTFFGLPEYIFEISGMGVSLPAGTYWLGLRPVGSTMAYFYWMTAPSNGSPVFVDYPDFGYPAWTPSYSVFGRDYDVSFCINGVIAGGCSYILGDVNANGAFNGIDVSYSVGYFKGGPVPPYTCDCNSSTWFVAGDVNGNCAFNGIDVSYMVAYFKGGSAPIPCPACPPITAASSIVNPSSMIIPQTNRDADLGR